MTKGWLHGLCCWPMMGTTQICLLHGPFPSEPSWHKTGTHQAFQEQHVCSSVIWGNTSSLFRRFSEAPNQPVSSPTVLTYRLILTNKPITVASERELVLINISLTYMACLPKNKTHMRQEGNPKKNSAITKRQSEWISGETTHVHLNGFENIFNFLSLSLLICNLG